MEVVKPEDLPRVELRGRVLYIAGECAAYRSLAVPLVVVKRLGRGVVELVETLKFALNFAPELVGFDFTVVEGYDDEEAELLRGLELSQLGKIIYIKC
ncbi:MAG: hypothetical protein QW598_11010 [Pyrobaculum sp.]